MVFLSIIKTVPFLKSLLLFKEQFYAWILLQDRIAALKVAQVEREEMAELIELNSDLVDKALLVIRSAIANQVKLFHYSEKDS